MRRKWTRKTGAKHARSQLQGEDIHLRESCLQLLFCVWEYFSLRGNLPRRKSHPVPKVSATLWIAEFCVTQHKIWWCSLTSLLTPLPNITFFEISRYKKCGRSLSAVRTVGWVLPALHPHAEASFHGRSTVSGKLNNVGGGARRLCLYRSDILLSYQNIFSLIDWLIFLFLFLLHNFG